MEALAAAVAEVLPREAAAERVAAALLRVRVVDVLAAVVRFADRRSLRAIRASFVVRVALRLRRLRARRRGEGRLVA